MILLFFSWLLSLFKPKELRGGAIDAPDVRDHIDVLPKNRITMPQRVSLMDIASTEHKRLTGGDLVFGTQGTGECTSWAFEIVKVLTNLCLHGEIINHDPIEHWAHQVEEYGASASQGATLLSSLKVGLKYHQGNPFSEYVKIPQNDLHHIKVRLAMGFAIFTGVSWKKTLDGSSNTYVTTLATGVWNYFKTKLVGGHSVAVTGYNDIKQVLIITESLRKWWGLRIVIATFEVPYSEVDKMMSMYILRDMKSL